MQKEEFDIKSSVNSYNISCTLFMPDNENVEKIIIACHGFGGDKESSAIKMLVSSLTMKNIGVIALDFPGHGVSKTAGEYFTVENCIADVEDVEKYVRDRFKNIQIGFFATSFGAYIILLKINRGNNKYSSVILRCPALKMREVFERNILKMSVDEFKKKGKCILGYERKILITKEFYDELVKNDIFKVYSSDNNLCIIHGTLDDMAPIEDTVAFQEKFKDNVKLHKIEGADHRFKKSGELDKVIKIATEYILSN